MNASSLLRTLKLAAVLLGCTGVLLYPIMAQEGAERLFDEGNTLYQHGQFDMALQKFIQINEQGLSSSALFYNIGNCYYKLNRVGKAILYYERALKLDPGDEDIEANLVIANQATVDNLSSAPEFALARWLMESIYFVSRQGVWTLLTILYLCLGALLGARVLSRNPTLKKKIGFASVMCGSLLVLFSCLALIQWWDSVTRIEAIIQVEEVSARSAPEDQGIEVFTLHEGAKVRVDQSLDGWVEIVLPDGKLGWVRAESLEPI